MQLRVPFDYIQCFIGFYEHISADYIKQLLRRSVHPFSKTLHFKFIGNKDANISDLLELEKDQIRISSFTEIAAYMRKNSG